MSEDDEAKDGAGASLDVRARLGSDFGSRLVSGLAMGVVAAVCTFLGAVPFAVLVVVVTVLLSWEWGRLVHGREADIVIAVHVGAVGVAAVLAAVGFVGLGLLALPIGAILAMLLSLGRNSLFSALGRLLCRAARHRPHLAALRRRPLLGLLAVVFLILVVVASDTAGFLAGRLLGGPKLWPRISPNKTWAGFVGALVASCDRRCAVLARRSGWLGRCGWRRPVPCCRSWHRPATSPSRPSSVASAPRIRVR